MWRILAARWRSRWPVLAGLCLAPWMAAAILARVLPNGPEAGLLGGLACGVSLTLFWLLQRIVAVIDQREERLGLHAALPLSLGSTARARVLDPVPGAALVLALCWVGLGVVDLATGAVAGAAYRTVATGALFVVLVEQLGFLMEEVQSHAPRRRLPKILAGLALGLAGMLTGLLTAHALGDRADGGALFLAFLGRPDTLLAVGIVATLLATANQRLFVRRPDLAFVPCAW